MRKGGGGEGAGRGGEGGGCVQRDGSAVVQRNASLESTVWANDVSRSVLPPGTLIIYLLKREQSNIDGCSE